MCLMIDRSVLLAARPKKCRPRNPPNLAYRLQRETRPPRSQRVHSPTARIGCSSYLPGGAKSCQHISAGKTWRWLSALAEPGASARQFELLAFTERAPTPQPDCLWAPRPRFGQLSHVLDRSSRARFATGACGAGRAWRPAINCRYQDESTFGVQAVRQHLIGVAVPHQIHLRPRLAEETISCHR